VSGWAMGLGSPLQGERLDRWSMWLPFPTQELPQVERFPLMLAPCRTLSALPR